VARQTPQPFLRRLKRSWESYSVLHTQIRTSHPVDKTRHDKKTTVRPLTHLFVCWPAYGRHALTRQQLHRPQMGWGDGPSATMHTHTLTHTINCFFNRTTCFMNKNTRWHRWHTLALKLLYATANNTLKSTRPFCNGGINPKNWKKKKWVRCSCCF
jgi:hypothetical protein